MAVPHIFKRIIRSLFVFIFFCGTFAFGYSHGARRNIEPLNMIDQFRLSIETRRKIPTSGYVTTPQAEKMEIKGLSEYEYPVYNELAQGLLNLQNPIIIKEKDATMAGITSLADKIQDCPDFYWVARITWCSEYTEETGNAYIVSAEYCMDKETRDATLQQIESVVASIWNENREPIKEGIQPAAACINQWLCDNVEYAQDEKGNAAVNQLTSTILGPLLYQEGICSGYAKTFSYLMARFGYTTDYITGYTDGGIYHAWNTVYVDDKEYLVDTTFNDTYTNPYRDTERFFFIPTQAIIDRTPDETIEYAPSKKAA